MTPSHRPRAWARHLVGVFAEVHGGEARTLIPLTLHVGCLLAAYYVAKPVREAWVLTAPAGAEWKAAATGLSAALLWLLMPLYGRLLHRWSRSRLWGMATGVSCAGLCAFYVLCSDPQLRPRLGVPFYLWSSVFSMVLLTQFWALASELYSVQQGERLFVVLGLGQTLGAVLGSKLAAFLAGSPLGPPAPTPKVSLLAAACLLALGLGLVLPIARALDGRGLPLPRCSEASLPVGALRLVWSHRFLRLLAGFGLLFTVVNSNGEYLLSKALSHTVAGLPSPLRERYVARFFGDFYFQVNLLGLLVQLLFVSRVLRSGGLRLAFAVFPLVALAGSLAVALWPILPLLRVTKTVENAIDYSLNNTARHVLWLPTTAETKYKAKQFVDTFMVRIGDLSASVLVVFATATLVACGWSEHVLRVLSGANALLCLVWWWLARALVHEHGQLLARPACKPIGGPQSQRAPAFVEARTKAGQLVDEAGSLSGSRR